MFDIHYRRPNGTQDRVGAESQEELGKLISSLSKDTCTVLFIQAHAEGWDVPVLTNEVTPAEQAEPAVPFSMVLEEYTGKRAVALDGLKIVDGVKPRYDLIPALAELEIAKAFTIGAAKYDAGVEDVQNWMHPSRTHRMMYSASQRHQTSRRLGEKVDSDTNRQHLALAIVDLMMMLEADLRGWADKDNFDPHCTKRPGV